MINYISAYKSQMTFMGLNFQADKLKIKSELRVMMAALWLKLNWKQYRVVYSSLQTGTNSLSIVSNISLFLSFTYKKI